MRDSRTIQKFVEDISTANVITKTMYIRFATRLFGVPKKNSDKVRIILELAPLNKFIACPTFRMTTTGDIMSIGRPWPGLGFCAGAGFTTGFSYLF